MIIDPAQPHLGGNIHNGDPGSWSPDLWKWLIETYHITSVLDVGCGEGHAAEFFQQQGLKVLCFDGLASNVETCRAKNLKAVVHDLTTGPFLASVDLVWCCEVAEHIEERYAINLIQTLRSGKYVAITAADPTQGGGYHHVNCQPQEYWVELMKPYQFLAKETLESRTRFPTPYWARTGMMFSRDSSPKEDIMISIIIPTYQHCSDYLQPCLEKVFSYTDMADKELIVVANGCTDGTRPFLDSLGVKYLWFDECLGYPKAVNQGIRASKGEYIVLLDNDSFLLPQNKNEWIRLLLSPMKDPKVGVTGPFAAWWKDIPYGPLMCSNCVCYRRNALEKVNLFDESFGHGYFCDGDVCARVIKAGYKSVAVPDEAVALNDQMSVGSFPYYHPPKARDLYPEVFEKNKKILYDRHGGQKEISIIIPTFNHLDDCLRPCLESIFKFTDLSNKEIIVVANGCTDGTRAYLDGLAGKVKYLWFDAPAGYDGAVNAGIKASVGQYVLLLNNDTVLLPQQTDTWIQMLKDPFLRDEKMGLTGPLRGYNPDIDRKFLIFFCVLIHRKVIDKIGILDETFNPGAGEDTAYCIEAEKAGFKWCQVPHEEDLHVENGRGVSEFPIFHIAEATVHDPNCIKNWGEVYKRNSQILIDRYKKKEVKLNIGCGPMILPGYINIDLNDEKADVKADVRKLPFPDDHADEILASHLIEHFHFREGFEVLKEWRRVLKPNGILIIECPDLLQNCKDFVAASEEQRVSMYGYFFGHPWYPNGGHQFGYTPTQLHWTLEQCGFRDISQQAALIYTTGCMRFVCRK